MFIDARGKACPMPVVMAKKQLDSGCGALTVEVDNETAVENLKKLGVSMGKKCEVENDGKDYKIFFPQGGEISDKTASSDTSGYS
ncbi:MAG: sulfurtransferase TusA family protein, partial [Oscillospiraceae bacterium]